MNPARWEQVNRVFHLALEVEPGQREAFLREACAGDESLFEEVSSLLAQEGTSEGFFESPALEAVAKGLAKDQAPATPDLTGQILSHYHIKNKIGEGGMGVVYRARDPRLGRDVAVKVLPGELTASPERLRRFEREARAVAALNHPNILTVFDVGMHDGSPYVVTELLEGETLLAFLSRHSPTPRQILSLALQTARGLEAAHARGIIHRDIKPQNLFVTADGRVKILDFGLAKLMPAQAPEGVAATKSDSTEGGQLLGTPGYMSPEQVRGLTLDARTDIFSFGVVLYELLSGKHPFRRETPTATLGAILEDVPPDLTTTVRRVSPQVARIVARCLEKRREERFASGHDLVVALEAVAAGASALETGVTEVEERSPYPGLSSFTEKDAAHFFGREAEVNALWQRLQSRKLLAVIGPSGAGKTSFVRAGVIPAQPEGWAALVCTPGNAPMVSLGRALARELAGDADALQDLVRFEDPDVAVSLFLRWRLAHEESLLVVDQLEELFTLNPVDVQARFAGFLGRLASEVDIHVVLSLRDDFLMRCHDHPGLAPVFSELTPLGALTPEGLERALVEPARKQGYRFEDEALVQEMVSAVAGARGALPLLAFAVARLWEKRDRERKLLTREAYEEIGGVAGALAQHAEATMDRIGGERQALVRDIFRNLVTAQGTRAVIDREELLSAFPERAEAEEVVRQLIDARLLTTYEVEGKEGEPRHHRVEIVHESLLKAWPRLVRWQAQDEEGAVLRDQLRQAAHLWEEKGRTDDLIWTGTAYQEFALWRGRYPGALTALEEDFARAMAERAQRKRRRRRLAAAAILGSAVVVALVTGVLWWRSETARRRAATEALRAEAGKLLALGRLDLETHPTAALAYARKSLELADTFEGRKFALDVLWRGPVARILPVAQVAKGLGLGGVMAAQIVPSPDGRWLATGSVGHREILLFPWDGGPARALPRPPDGNTRVLDFGPESDLLITGGSGESLRLWSMPELREIRSAELERGVFTLGRVAGGRLFTLTRIDDARRKNLLQVWPLPDGAPRVLGTFECDAWDIDAGGKWFAYAWDRKVRVRRLDASSPGSERILGSVPNDLVDVIIAPTGDSLASLEASGEIRLWSLAAGARAPLRILEVPKAHNSSSPLVFDRNGSLLATGAVDGSLYVWDLNGPPDAQPAVLRRPDEINFFPVAIDPSNQWLAASDGRSLAFWPLSGPWMRTLRGNFSHTYYLPFSADGRWLASCSIGEAARVWPLSPADGNVRVLAQGCFSIATHPASSHVLVGTDKVFLVPIEGGRPRQLLDRWEGGVEVCVALDTEGRRAAACGWSPRGLKDPKQRVLRIWDLESGRDQVFSLVGVADASWNGFDDIAFAQDGSLFVSGRGGVRRLILPAGPSGRVLTETLYANLWAGFSLSRDGQYMLVWGTAHTSVPADGCEELLLFDLREHGFRRITTHGGRVRTAALDASARIIVTADIDGIVRAGPVTGEEPHLLLGQTGSAMALGVSPDCRWIASSSSEVIHVWPMPDVTKPPLHTLPYDELMAKLRALTNLQVVEDKTTATGWKLEIGPFPGWKDVPTW